MSSLQSLRESISKRLAAAAEEIFQLCEGTIVQYEEELCRQRRLLDIAWKPQLQLHAIVLPQHCVTEVEDLCNQQRNFVELQEPEPLPIKEEPGELCISQEEDQLDLKQETDTLMEVPTYEEYENNEADLNNQQRFIVNDSQNEEGNQFKESISSTDEDTEPQNRDQWKRRDRSNVQSVDNSHMSATQCDSDDSKKSKNDDLVKKHIESPKEKIPSSIKADKICYVCKECGRSFCFLSQFRIHIRTHTGEKQFACKECKKRFGQKANLQRHMRTHTGEKPFSCRECDKSFSDVSNLKAHMLIHTGEKAFSCKECDKNFTRIYHLQRHMITHMSKSFFL